MPWELFTSRTFIKTCFENNQFQFNLLSTNKILRILFPRISENKNTHITISIATPFVAVSGMRTDTAYGRARLPYPRRFAVLVTVYMQAGVIRVYPGWFWRWPVAALRLRLGAYASAA